MTEVYETYSRMLFFVCFSIYAAGLDAVNKKYLKEIVKEGILTKRGQAIRSLKERHFILTPRLLTYHENNKEKTKKGEIHINEVIIYCAKERFSPVDKKTSLQRSCEVILRRRFDVTIWFR